jgi:hypothetical protein
MLDICKYKKQRNRVNNLKKIAKGNFEINLDNIILENASNNKTNWVKNLNYVRNLFDTYIKISILLCFQFYFGEGRICFIEFGYGPDVISHKMLKLCPNKIALPLQIIFNKSFQQSKYPMNWKLAHVIAVFKKGDSSLPSNNSSKLLIIN